MQLLYNWQLYDHPIPTEQPLYKYITPPKPSLLQPQSSQSLNTTLQPLTLKSPIFSIVFCYLLEDIKSSNPEIHLFPELTLFDNKIQITLLQQRRERNCICQLVKVQNCECYDTMLTLSAKVKYIQGHSSKINSIDKLITLVGSRKLNSHSYHTHSIIKKQLTIEQPVTVEMRYNTKGYMIVKLTRGEQFTSNVFIEDVQALTWLADNQQVKNYQAKNIQSTTKAIQKLGDNPSKTNYKVIKLAPKEVYSLMFMLPQNLKESVQIPISILFSFDVLNQQKFKIIKYLKIQ